MEGDHQGFVSRASVWEPLEGGKKAEAYDVCSRKIPLAPELRTDGRAALGGAGTPARAYCRRTGERYWHLRPGSRGWGEAVRFRVWFWR